MVHRLSIFLALLVLLVACGGAPTTPAAAPTDAPAVPAPTSAPAAEGATRMITHPLGKTEIPANPQRIAVVGYNEVEELLALGITPIARLYQTPAHFPPEAARIPLIGNDAGQPNLEQLLELKPDLIVGPDWALTEQYDLLSQIAPTIVVPRGSFAEWQEALRFTADVVGRSTEAEELLAAYEQRVAEVRDAIGADRLTELEVTAFRPYTDGSGFLIWVDRSFADVIMADVGIKRSEAQRAALPEGEERIDDLSLEFIPLLDADVIFLALPESGSFAAGANEGLDTWLTSIETSPLWAQLQAVQNEQVFKVDAAVWNEGSIIGANALLDDLERHLGGDAAAPASATNPAALVVIEETGEYRLIKHSLGETQVPLQPQRVVTLQDQNALLPLFELGFTNVVGSVGDFLPDGSSYFRRMQNFDTSGVQFVGQVYEPNLEAIAALRPDLIVAGQYEITEDNYELLSAIAPTVVIEQFTRSIWASHADFALLVNRQTEADALKQQFDARLAEVKAQLVNPEQITVSLFYVGEGGTINAEADPNLPYHTIFDGLGLGQIALVEQARARDQFYAFEENVSLELLSQFDADLVFVPFWGGEPGPDIAALQASPLWQQLNAVQKGQAYIIPGEQWYGLSYQPLFNILDGIEQYVIEAQPDLSWEPAP